MIKLPDATGPSQRWTAAAIRAATPFPKPKGALDASHVATYGRDTEINSRERLLLRYIAEHADLLDVQTPPGQNFERHWLLINLDRKHFQTLTQIEAASADLAPDGDTEDGGDDEAEHDDENGGDAEPDLAHAEKCLALPIGNQAMAEALSELRDEQRLAYTARTGREPYDNEAARANYAERHAQWRAEIEATPLHENYKDSLGFFRPL